MCNIIQKLVESGVPRKIAVAKVKAAREEILTTSPTPWEVREIIENNLGPEFNLNYLPDILYAKLDDKEDVEDA